MFHFVVFFFTHPNSLPTYATVYRGNSHIFRAQYFTWNVLEQNWLVAIANESTTDSFYLYIPLNCSLFSSSFFSFHFISIEFKFSPGFHFVFRIFVVLFGTCTRATASFTIDILDLLKWFGFTSKSAYFPQFLFHSNQTPLHPPITLLLKPL